jgi:hypothetical protein
LSKKVAPPPGSVVKLMVLQFAPSSVHFRYHSPSETTTPGFTRIARVRNRPRSLNTLTIAPPAIPRVGGVNHAMAEFGG